MSVCFADSLFAIPVNLLLHLVEEWQMLSSRKTASCLEQEYLLLESDAQTHVSIGFHASDGKNLTKGTVRQGTLVYS